MSTSSFFSFAAGNGRRLLFSSAHHRTWTTSNATFIKATAASAVTLVYWWSSIRIPDSRITECEEEAAKAANTTTTTITTKPRIAFLGTGSSTGCPRPLCTMMFPPLKEQQQQQAERSGDIDDESKKRVQELLRSSYCRTSIRAMEGADNPRHNKDYRNNPSLLITTPDNKNIIIDTGKTFREGALRWFPVLGVESIDAIVLTHEHMDASAGLDDLRGFQKWTGLDKLVTKAKDNKSTTGFQYLQAVPMPIFASQQCLERVSEQFPWLIKKEAIIGSKGKHHSNNKDKDKDSNDTANKPIVKRHVASFDVNVIENYKSFNAEGLDIIPLPIMHGEDLVSLGFAFSIGQLNVIYLSDISRMIPETLEFIKNKLPQPTHVLVIDSLHPVKPNPVHYSLEQAIDLKKQINPEQTYLVGMSCDSWKPHDEMNIELREKYGGTVKLANDGLVIDASS